MSGDLQIRCTCGAVQGVARDVSRREANRVVCYCDDCQAFAHFLGRAGEILDAHGGTEVVQMSPARLEIDAGTEQLRCMRLTPKGTCRWYTACCRTPIGNTLATHQVPFVGLVSSCVQAGAGRDALDLALGPIHGRVWGRFAKGDTRGLTKLHARVPLLMLLRVGRLLLTWRLRGDHRQSPFFEPDTGEPVSAPHVLTDDERGHVLNARDGTA